MTRKSEPPSSLLRILAKQSRNRILNVATECEPGLELTAFLRCIHCEIKSLPSAIIGKCKVKGTGSEYNLTFTCSPENIPGVITRKMLRRIARDLQWIQANPPQEILIIRKLFNSDWTSKQIRIFFAMLRHELVSFSGKKRSALYTPLGDTGKATPFPLHSDLYLPELLFNVFDKIPEDKSGASLFCSTDTVLKFFRNPKAKDIPTKVRTAVRNAFEKKLQSDLFDQIYDYLHGDWPWVDRLHLAMKKNQYRIHLRRGDGYLIHDRKWMHGRTAPSKAVTENRVHRLVF